MKVFQGLEGDQKQAESRWESICGERFVWLFAVGDLLPCIAKEDRKPQAYWLEASVQKGRAAKGMKPQVCV